MFRLKHIAFALALLSGGLSRAEASALSQPSADDMYFIYLAVSGTAPDFDGLGKSFSRYQQADEFARADVLGMIEADLRAEQKAVASVTEITIPIAASFSEYDLTYHEFVFTQLSDGTFLPFSPFGADLGFTPSGRPSVAVALLNGSDFSSWSLAPDAAKAVFERNRQSREVTLMIDIVLTGGRQTADQTFRLDGRIKTIRVLGDRQQPLGEITPSVAAP